MLQAVALNIRNWRRSTAQFTGTMAARRMLTFSWKTKLINVGTQSTTTTIVFCAAERQAPRAGHANPENREDQQHPPDDASPTEQQQSQTIHSEDDAVPGSGRLMFPGLRLLHAEPPVIGVDDFFTHEECDHYIAMSTDAMKSGQAKKGSKTAPGEGGPHMQRSATLGADVDAVAQVPCADEKLLIFY